MLVNIMDFIGNEKGYMSNENMLYLSFFTTKDISYYYKQNIVVVTCPSIGIGAIF
jgi:hypothetical protein